jgi:hypothetical protein
LRGLVGDAQIGDIALLLLLAIDIPATLMQCHLRDRANLSFHSAWFAALFEARFGPDFTLAD